MYRPSSVHLKISMRDFSSALNARMTRSVNLIKVLAPKVTTQKCYLKNNLGKNTL